MQAGVIPVPAVARELEYVAACIGAVGVRGALQAAGRIGGQRIERARYGALFQLPGERIEHREIPTASRRRELKHRASSVQASVGGCAVEVAGLIEDQPAFVVVSIPELRGGRG